MPPPKSRASAPADRQSREPTPLPTYQSPHYPLNATAKRALEFLPRDHKLDGLKNKLRAANSHLTQAAADINDRLQGRNAEFERIKKRRLEKQDSHEDNAELDMALNKMRQETDGMTNKIEESVRRIIDAGAEVERMERALREVHADVSNSKGFASSTQSTSAASQLNHSRRSRNVDSDDEGTNYEDGPTTQPTRNTESTMETLKQKIAEQREAYQAMSKAHRYASHNDYIGFKKMVHDAHYPEDSAPPMPHASTWFAVEADDGPSPETRSAAAAANASADDDLAVASERISIKCPITLLDMKDPVTSQKCPHSFEKAAILDMIRMSEDTLPGTRQKAIQCPVCTVQLTADDVKEDPVIVRKIQRIQAAMNADNDYSSDEEDVSRGRRTAAPGPVHVSSSPATTRIHGLKSERRSRAHKVESREVSMVPNTQLQVLVNEEVEGPSSSAIVDLEDEDEDDDDDDDDDEIEDMES